MRRRRAVRGAGVAAVTRLFGTPLNFQYVALTAWFVMGVGVAHARRYS